MADVPKDDARFTASNDPQSRKEDVGFEYDVQAKSLQDEADREGYHAFNRVRGFDPEYPADRITSGTAESEKPADPDSLTPNPEGKIGNRGA